MQKRCLIISYGPVPTPEHQTVEGGGMRVWGLAKGLQANGIDVTVAINAGFPRSLESHEGIRLASWNLDNDFIGLINSHDAVIVSYCMGDLSTFVADNIRDDISLILDAYVPIYIEVSARDAKNMNEEYANYMADVQRHNHTLRRGDYFLYANPAQELLYTGVLSALGIINPHSYKQKRLIYAPFGIHRDAITSKMNPYTPLGIKKDDFVVLWFGGIYPWFRIEEYLEAIKSLSKNPRFKFVFVGGKNPFNGNPDIARQYDKALKFSQDNDLLENNMHFIDWVDFDTRINWFRNADIIISLNQPGEENKFSWRTRVMDFVWGETATITNGGDPLSEEMVASGAAVKLDTLSTGAIVDALTNLQQNPALVADVQKNVKRLKDKYFWDVVTKEIAGIVADSTSHPYADETNLRKLVDPENKVAPQGSGAAAPGRNVVTRLGTLPLKVVRKVRQKGIRRTAKVATDILKAQAKQRALRKTSRQYVFISHPINNTGAPIVLIQIIEEYVQKYGAGNIRVIATGVEKNQENYLKSLGVTVEKAVANADFRFIRLQLGLRPDDYVLMNTVAIHDNYRDFILLWLKLGRLKHAYWFIHEDIAQLPIINPRFLDKANIGKIRSLISSKKLSPLYPSKRTLEDYRSVFGVRNNGKAIKLKVEIPETYKKPRTTGEFDTIDILLSGTSSDGRKGQVLALSAIQQFVDTIYSKDPNKYRRVNLHLVAIGSDDYISKQIRWVGETSSVKDFVKIYDILPKGDAMEIAQKCNVVMCCSLNETFGLYIAEGMLMGHIVLRNDTAGVDEQLSEGSNGYLIDHTNIASIVKAIEKLASTSATNAKLLKMSARSQEMMQEYTKHSYIDQI